MLRERCVVGITPNPDRMRWFVEHSIGIVTALVPVIGYETATEVAKTALLTGRYQYRLPIGLEEPLQGRPLGLPPEHPTLAGKLGLLANTLAAIGEWTEAEELSAEALAMRRKALPAGSTRLANSLYNHAVLLLDSGRASAALPLLEEAESAAAAAFGPADFRTLLIASARVYALIDAGGTSDARALAARTGSASPVRPGQGSPRSRLR